MGSILSSCIKVVRDLPQSSALDLPWHWMEEHNLTDSSVIYPEFDLKNEQKIQQTAARLFFALILPSLAKPFGYANVGLGAIHLVWCFMNITKIKKREESCSPQDIEKALIRLVTGVYDLAIGYLLYSSFMNYFFGRPIISLAFAFLPSYTIQLHHLVFEKATKIITEKDSNPEAEPKTEVDHQALRVGCLIKQFCNGLVLTFLPEPEAPQGYKDRLWTFPYAIGAFFTSSYARVWKTPTK